MNTLSSSSFFALLGSVGYWTATEVKRETTEKEKGEHSAMLTKQLFWVYSIAVVVSALIPPESMQLNILS